MDIQRSADRDWPRTTLLGRLPTTARAALLSAGVEAEQPAGRYLLRQGDQGDHAHLLVTGTVKITLETADGVTALLGMRVGGDLVGEMGALEGRARSANAIACAPLVSRILQRHQVTGLMARHPEISLEIARMISWRLRWANRRREDITVQPRMRVCRVLMDIALHYGHQHDLCWDLGVSLTQAELASLAGIKKRTAEAELGKLQREQVIVRHYRRIQITDMGRLEFIANGTENPHQRGFS